MRYKLKDYSILEVGQKTDMQGNPRQEDYIYPLPGNEKSTDRLFVLCDGMGGHDSGDLAAQTVCTAIRKNILSSTSPDGDFTKQDLQNALKAAYEALDDNDTGAEKKMGTTLAMLKLYDRGYLTAHIGDSRVYHFRPGKTGKTTKIVFRTEDHSLVNHLVKKGEMTVEEALTSPQRNIITRAMQPHMEKRCRADVYTSADIESGDYFMVCSDGMIEDLSDEILCNIFSNDGGNAKNKVGLLRKATANTEDNHSAIIVHIISVIEDDAEEEIEKEETTPVVTEKSTPKPKAEKKTSEKKMKNPISTISKTKGAVKAKEFVNKHTSDGDIGPLIIKFMLIIMGVLILMMLIYYIFIHKNETLQAAGTAVDPVPEVYDDTEKYGYEITEQDKINEAQPIAPEEQETEEISIDDLPDHGGDADDTEDVGEIPNADTTDALILE